MKAAIQFSGGKDSLALLYLLRDRAPEFTVYFGDTGAVYPHVSHFVRQTCARLGFVLRVVMPPVPIATFHAARGLPSDIVPVEASCQMQPYLTKKRETLLQSPLECCAAMVWSPLQRAMQDDAVTDIYRGSKRCDGHVGVPDGHRDVDGVVYHSPLWEWRDDDVFAYLAGQGAQLPEHYGTVNNSFDCMTCTAFLNHPGAAARLRWTREHYPQAWPQIAGRLALVRRVLAQETELVCEALNL